MAIYKLHIDELDEIDYILIAIHTLLEDHRLAYFLNQKLSVLLEKRKPEIEIAIKEGPVYFSRYVFENPEKEISWTLIQNRNEILLEKKDNTQNLFSDTYMEPVTKIYLLPEFKKIDYFLKIENPGQSIASITTSINQIERVSAVYNIDMHKIKSKNNLIF